MRQAPPQYMQSYYPQPAYGGYNSYGPVYSQQPQHVHQQQPYMNKNTSQQTHKEPVQTHKEPVQTIAQATDLKVAVQESVATAGNGVVSEVVPEAAADVVVAEAAPVKPEEPETADEDISFLSAEPVPAEAVPAVATPAESAKASEAEASAAADDSLAEAESAVSALSIPETIPEEPPKSEPERKKTSFDRGVRLPVAEADKGGWRREKPAAEVKAAIRFDKAEILAAFARGHPAPEEIK